MDKNYKNHLTTLLVGLSLGIIFLFNLSETPDNPVIQNHSGLSSTFLSITLAANPDEIYGIIGGPEQEEFMDYIDRFKSLLLYDIILIVFYSIFFFQVIGFTYRNSASNLPVYLLSILIFITAVSDIGQNFQIQAILDSNSAEKMEEPIQVMGVFTLIKWLTLFIVSAFIGMSLWLNEKGIILKVTAVCFFTAFLFYISSFLRPNLIELGILFLLISFVLFWSYSFLLILLSKKT